MQKLRQSKSDGKDKSVLTFNIWNIQQRTHKEAELEVK